jgi:hypothetical protein
VQTYRYHLSEEQRERLKSLLKVQQHHTITAEIRKELFGVNMSSAASKKANQSIVDNADMISDDSD